MSWDWVAPLGGLIGATGGLIGGSLGIWGAYRARSADIRVKEIDARDRERRDVAWSGGWASNEPEEPTWRVKNIGIDVAHNVEVVLHANDPGRDRPHRQTATRIGPGGTIDFDLSAEWAADQDRYAHDAEMIDPPIIYVPPTPNVEVTSRILWSSALGTPGSQRDPAT
ncbi:MULTISPECIES: hypothetical protein [unclassified Rhodococcus (in: high G+C Gram-positive bacteria)]|uniref:hypothetical protein n=1 Tax=unclassified Rhodococcus (in: high G+C Gram-positive bacteria) TaxID=192944 RepID=UPI00339AC88A